MTELDDIFDEEPLENNEPIEVLTAEPETELNDNLFLDTQKNEPAEETVLDELLKAKGIENSMIRILDENNVETKINFYDLSKEEQLEILNQERESSNENLDDSEIELINLLRTNNLSIQDYLEQYKESILAEVQQPIESSYEIDNYGDEELFLLDLKNKFDLTDEELEAELEKELVNKPLFTKKVSKLREDYKSLEDNFKASQQAEQDAQRQKQYQIFVDSMVDIATSVSDFHGVFLEDDEKQETLSYLLETDDSGMSKFSKDMEDPNKLYEAAWYLRYGKEAFEALEAAYEAEIAKLKKTDKPRVVVQNSEPKIKHINELL